MLLAFTTESMDTREVALKINSEGHLTTNYIHSKSILDYQCCANVDVRRRVSVFRIEKDDVMASKLSDWICWKNTKNHVVSLVPMQNASNWTIYIPRLPRELTATVEHRIDLCPVMAKIKVLDVHWHIEINWNLKIDQNLKMDN